MKCLGILVIAILLALLSSRFVVHGKPESCSQQASMDGMPQDSAACMAFMPTWTYDASQNSCSQFVFGGCGGNSNQFSSKDECEKACKD